MRLSDNEHIAVNNIQIHRLEKLYEENRSLFNELVDFIPLMITISKVRGFSFFRQRYMSAVHQQRQRIPY